MATLTLAVRGMHCPGCASRLGKVLGLQPGVSAAAADFLKGCVQIETIPEAVVDRVALEAAVSGAGFIPGAWREEAT
jgi:copper chaperone CopZ